MANSSSVAHDLNQLRDAYQAKLPAEIHNLRALWDKLLNIKWSANAFGLMHRMVHNLAGSAGSYGLPQIGELAASMDQLLQQLEDHHTPPGERERARITGMLQRLETMVTSSPGLEVLEAGYNLTPDKPEPAAGITRVLMLEDDNDHAVLIQAHLEHHGCSVTVVANTAALEQALGQGKPDVLIVDVMLPGDPTAGINAVNAARARGQLDIPVLFMSARGDLEARMAAVQAGGTGYFTKPVDINELIRRIDTLKDNTETQYRVLVVDDDADTAIIHSLLLRKAGLITRELTRPMQLLHVLQEFRPDLILMDLHMPECPGGTLTQVIRQDARFADIPVLFLSGESDPAQQNSALGQGGDAFLVKPVSEQQLVDAVANRVKRARCLAQRLQKLGQHDPHTGLINQDVLLARLEISMNELSGADTAAALLFIEINDFRAVRNQVKFVSTELLVTNVATTIRNEIGPTEQLARVGSASFVVLLPGVSPATALAVSDRIRKAVAARIYPAGIQSLALTVSIGVAPLNEIYQHADDWLSGAAIACDIARAAGDNKSYLHNPDSDRQVEQEHFVRCGRQLRAALDNDDMYCVYQPIASLCGDPQEKYDVLLRMRNTNGEEVLPARFMPVAKKEGLSTDIDRWVSRHAVRVLAQRHRDGRRTTLFIKLSAATLADAEFIPWLARLLAAEQLRASSLVFEFSESSVTTRLNEASTFINKLHRLGCAVALEHFGTSLDSAQLLKHLAPDYIKVDGAFVHGLEQNPANQDTIRKLLDPSGQHGVRVIASFIEDATSLSVLFQCGVHFIQGNFLQEPRELMDFSFNDELD